MLRMLRSRQQTWRTDSIPASFWINWQVTWALRRALARGPSGTLMQSMPADLHNLAPAISLEASRPRGGRISTKETNSLAASFAPSLLLAATGIFSIGLGFATGSSITAAEAGPA